MDISLPLHKKSANIGDNVDRISKAFVLDLPINIFFPCLETLGVAHVMYVDDASMHRLFSSLPDLENLAMRRDGWHGA
ncbi:unnamed protein product [Dovyalis caffra]|uniref:Uncharacterized protein n=1 Tax=Dovyalis caffra TaxID=77055 RepID=A0AAV1RSJ4_9ROSI|nr:unnamed protein product [Dovyalis caffra]